MTDHKQNDLSKTKPYSTKNDNASNKTQTYQDDPNKTKAYKAEVQLADQTVGYESEETKLTDRTIAHNLGIGDKIELNGKECEITDIISGEQQSLEAVIYKITHASGKDYALKLYYKFTNPKDEPNPEALARIKAIKDPDILKLHDFGTDHSKYRNKFCFEVCDFAKGSNLISVPEIRKKYTIEFLESNVVPEIFKGIRTLHDYKIYHCDLKPENIFYLDKKQTDLIIGDYGSAKTFEESSEKQTRRTSTFKGTDFYLAPEQARGIVSEKNDYHSFGMILLHLLYPELVNRQHLDKIIERQFARKPIIDFNPEFGRINDLIAGLTLVDASSRWGENEVKSWLRGDSVEVKYSGTVEAQVQPINLGKTVIRTVENIINYIENDSGWYENLIEDNEGYTLLLRWVSDLQGVELKKVFDKMVRTYQQDGKDYVYQAILRYFNPDRPVQVDMKAYDFWGAKNVAELTESFVKHIDDIWKITDLEKIKFYMFQLEFTLKQIEIVSENQSKLFFKSLLEKIASGLFTSQNDDFCNYLCMFYTDLDYRKLINLCYTFNSHRGFKDLENNIYFDIEKIGLLFAESSFDNRYLVAEKDIFLEKNNLASLKQFEYNEFLFEIFKKNVNVEFRFEDISIISEKNTLKYTLKKSLKDFFLSKNIANPINTEFSDNTDQHNFYSYSFDMHTFQSKKSIYNEFLKHAEREHNIPEELISDSSKQEFYKSFKKTLKLKLTENKNKNYIKNLKKIFFIGAVILGSLVFLFYAIDWNHSAEIVYDKLEIAVDKTQSIGESGLAWISEKKDLVHMVIKIIPGVIWYLFFSGLVTLILFILLKISSYLFPLLAGLFIFFLISLCHSIYSKYLVNINVQSKVFVWMNRLIITVLFIVAGLMATNLIKKAIVVFNL